MKIVACHNYYQIRGGEDQSFEDEVALLRAHGDEVITYTRHNDEVGNASKLGVARDTLLSRKTYRELTELLTLERPDILHCTNTFPLISPSAYRAARKCGVPVVQSLRNYRLLCAGGYLLRDGAVCEKCVGKTFAWPAVLHKCYRGSAAGSAVVAALQTSNRVRGVWHNDVDAFYTLTEFAKQKLSTAGLPAERVFVKPNCVTPAPGVGRGEGNYSVFVGRLSPEKGLDTIFSAWRSMPNAPLLKVIGDGPEESKVRAFCAEHPQVEYLGRLRLSDALPIVGRAKCLIMPSLWYETFGRTLIEAFATGTPVIASRLGAMAEVVSEGRTGLLFTAGDARDLAAKVNTMFAMPQNEMASWRTACRHEYETLYTPERNYELLHQIYARARLNAGRHVTPTRVKLAPAAKLDRCPS
jgi:glycosyltransferase involved in cell wall biosynthesis